VQRYGLFFKLPKVFVFFSTISWRNGLFVLSLQHKTIEVMKRLVSILLLVFGVTTSFAQSSTPDYIQKAKVGLNQYYPQFRDHFEPIIKRISNFGTTNLNIINSNIHYNFDVFVEELTTDRDKCATILTVLESIIGDSTFIKSKKQVDSSDGVDIINGIASEIYQDINVQLHKSLRENKEKLAKTRKEIALNDERIKKIDELNNFMKNSIPSQEAWEKIATIFEDYFKLWEISDIEKTKDLQNAIDMYITFAIKRINRRPSPLGQKFIDEYNRITKSK
jgi:hypothetical protein